MRHAIIAMLALAALAGCTGDQGSASEDGSEEPLVGPDDAGSADDASTGPPPKLYNHTGRGGFGWTALVGTPPPVSMDITANPQGGDPTFRVPEDSRVLYANATWSCATPTCPLEVHLVGSDGGETVLEGDGAARFTVETPREGSWTLEFAATGLSPDVQGTVQWKAVSPEEPGR